LNYSPPISIELSIACANGFANQGGRFCKSGGRSRRYMRSALFSVQSTQRLVTFKRA